MESRINIPSNKGESDRTGVVNEIVKKIKSQGLFDKFRKECLADVDTKPAYRNLQQRVEGYVARFLAQQIWTPKMNKNQMRDMLRKHINQSALLISGVERIVEQALNPKIFTTIKPKIDEVVCEHLGIDIVERRREMEGKREQQNLHHAHNVPQQLMAIDPTYVPAAMVPPADMNPAIPYNSGWQHQFPPYFQGSQFPGIPGQTDFPPQYISQQFMHQWGSHQHVEPTLAAPGTEDTLIPPGTGPIHDHTEPEDMDLCDDLPEPPPLPPEPEPPPDERPALPPEPEPEDDEGTTPEDNGTPTVHTPPLTDTHDPSNPLTRGIGSLEQGVGSLEEGGEVTEESQVTEEIVEMEIACDGEIGMSDVIHIDNANVNDESKQDTEAPDTGAAIENKYHFDWTQELDVDISDVESVSTIHTSDLSSFSDDLSDSGGEWGDEKKNVDEAPPPDLVAQALVPPVVDVGGGESRSPPPVVCEEVVSPVKPRRLIALQYNYSDSEEDETREERKLRIAKEKAERYAKRQQRRAELEVKKKEKEVEKARVKDVTREAPVSDIISADTDQKLTSAEDTFTESPIKTSPNKSSPDKRRKTKAQRKEELRELKVNEKRQALRRQRTRNKRYTSDEFTSIFTDSKRPFASRSYDTIVTADDICPAETVVLCEDVITEPFDENVIETTEIDNVKDDNCDVSIARTTECYVDLSRDTTTTDDCKTATESDTKTNTEPDSKSRHKRNQSPFSDVSDISLSEAIPEEPAEKRGRKRSAHERDSPDRRKTAAISPETQHRSRSQRYDMDDLYKPKTSRRRASSPLVSLDTTRRRRNKSQDKNQPTKDTSDESLNKDTPDMRDSGTVKQEPGSSDQPPKSHSPSWRRSHSSSHSSSRSRSRSFSRSRSRSRSSRRRYRKSPRLPYHRPRHQRRPLNRPLNRDDFGMAAQHSRMRDMLGGEPPGYMGPHPGFIQR